MQRFMDKKRFSTNQMRFHYFCIIWKAINIMLIQKTDQHMLSENVVQSSLHNVSLNILTQNVVQITLINILEQHRGFAQHFGQMIGDDGRC